MCSREMTGQAATSICGDVGDPPVFLSNLVVPGELLYRGGFPSMENYCWLDQYSNRCQETQFLSIHWRSRGNNDDHFHGTKWNL